MKAQQDLYVLHLHLLSRGCCRYCYYLPFFQFQRFSEESTFLFFVCPCVFCFYFCVFLPLLYSLAVIFIFFNVWVEAVQRRSSTPGKCHKSNVCKTGNTPLIQPAEYNDTAGFNLVLSVIY